MQVPAYARQPEARFTPPVELKVEVAVEKLMPLVVPMERREPGVVDEMPTFPPPVAKRRLPAPLCTVRVPEEGLIEPFAPTTRLWLKIKPVLSVQDCPYVLESEPSPT